MVACVLGNADTFGPSLSGDGRLVALGSFESFDGCTAQLHVYVHDRSTGVTTCVSRSPAGTPANNGNFVPKLSADGRIVVFDSNATNLLGPGVDTNGRGDVFVARVPVGVSWLVTGAGAGGGAHVRGFDPAGGATPLSRIAFGGPFGVQVATGDLDGDGAVEVITGAGPGGGPHVRMFTRTDASAELLPGGAFVYAPAFTGGVYVAAGKVVGTPPAQLVTGAGAGGGPHVRIFDVSAAGITERAGFFAFHPAFGGGVRVATCDVDGDGRAEVVVGAGPGGGPHVRVIGLEAGGVVERASFFAYEPEFTGGVYVGCGAVEETGLGSIVTGKGEGASPHVRVWSVDTAAGTVSDAGGFLAFTPGFLGGVRVAVGDVDGSGVGKILAAAGPGGGPHVRAFTAAGTSTLSFFAYNVGFLGGVFVGGYEP
jgi:hypothetical protein